MIRGLKCESMGFHDIDHVLGAQVWQARLNAIAQVLSADREDRFFLEFRRSNRLLTLPIGAPESEHHTEPSRHATVAGRDAVFGCA